MLEACALTDPGRVRTTNQDFFQVVPELGLYLLADGMGGARGGARASQVAVETVAEILGKSSHRDAAALLGAVEEATSAFSTRPPAIPALKAWGPLSSRRSKRAPTTWPSPV